MKRGNSRGAKDPCRPNVSIRSKENRLDESPTTEERGGLNWDECLAEPEKKSGVKLPPKVSKLRKKLAHKAKQEPKLRFYAPAAFIEMVASCLKSLCPLSSTCSNAYFVRGSLRGSARGWPVGMLRR